MKKRRLNYLSYLIDSSTESVARIGKISAFWATMSEGVIFINLVIYLQGDLITPFALVMLSFLYWSACFSILMIVQLSWIAYLVYNNEEWIEPIDDTTPTPPTTTTKYYVPSARGYKIDKVVSRVGESDGMHEDMKRQASEGYHPRGCNCASCIEDIYGQV